MVNLFGGFSIGFAVVTLALLTWLLITLSDQNQKEKAANEKAAQEEAQRKKDEQEKQRQKEEEEEREREKKEEEEREKSLFSLVPGTVKDSMSNPTGFCKGTSDSFPFFQNIATGCDTAVARKKCVAENSCVAFNVNEAEKACQLFYRGQTDADNLSSASPNWKTTNLFPLYASPYVCPSITSPKNKNGCTTTYPGVCGVVPGWACYNKSAESLMRPIPSFSDNEDADAVQGRVIVSNPYLQPSELLSTPGTFFWWLYNMLQECPADSELFLCNVYITLFKHNNENPADHATQCFYALQNALLRNVTVWWIMVASDSQQCQADILEQPGIQEHVGVNLKVVDFGTSGFLFFHDKIYLSEKRAYVGGQNLSASASIDCGVELLNTSPLFSDVRRRVEYLRNKGTTPLTFHATSSAPFVAPDSGASYFIAVSPSAPTQTNQQGTTHCNFPQKAQLKQETKEGQFVLTSPWQYDGHVAYELPHMLNIINNSVKHVSITNYDWSVYGDWFTSIKMGTDWSIALALEAALKRGVSVTVYISAMPFNDSTLCGNTTCVALRCSKFSSWLSRLQTSYLSLFHMHWWYQAPAGDSFNNYCHPLHAKICYTDAGFHISSSNLTPQYYSGTQDTGVCGVFPAGVPTPAWVANGIKSVFDILTAHATSGKYTCDNNSTPNFQRTSNTGKSLCSSDGSSCVNTCAGSVGMWSDCDEDADATKAL